MKAGTWMFVDAVDVRARGQLCCCFLVLMPPNQTLLCRWPLLPAACGHASCSHALCGTPALEQPSPPTLATGLPNQPHRP